MRDKKKKEQEQEEQWLSLIKEGNFWKFKNYLESHPSVLKQVDKKNGGTPLHWACYSGRIDIINFLLEKGASLYVVAVRTQETPLHLLALSGRNVRKILEIFIKKFGVEFVRGVGKKKDEKNRTAIDVAVEKNYLDVATVFYYSNVAPVYKVDPSEEPHDSCPRRRMRVTSEVLGRPKNSLKPVIGQKAHAYIVHRSKTDAVKYRYPIADIHHQLRVTHNSAETPQGNTITVNMSFEILIEGVGMRVRDHITFPLQIPGNLSSPSMTQSGLRMKDHSIYKKLKPLYRLGRKVRGMQKREKHGAEPQYDEDNSSQKQFIRHSEQTLAAYLCTPVAVQMLVNRLVSSIRSKHQQFPHGSKVKVYSVVIHIHSDKMPCGPCELTLVGLQNSWKISEEFKSFTEYLREELAARTKDYYAEKPNAPFRFIFPGFQLNDQSKSIQAKAVLSPKKGIRLFTTYTADGVDGKNGGVGHSQERVAAKPVHSRSPSLIQTNNRMNSSVLWVANFGKNIKGVVSNVQPDAEYRTSLLSGSDTTPETKKSKSKIEAVAEQNLKIVGKLLDSFLATQKKLEQLSLNEAKQANAPDATADNLDELEGLEGEVTAVNLSN